jgi:predicted RNA-binding protein with PIN domain
VSFTKHLIVDGANILHASRQFSSLLKRDGNAARSQLTQQLSVIHDVEQIRVTIVFDGRGEEMTVERPSQQPTFSVIYTPSSLTADDVIEQMVANSADASTCVVATDDRSERETVMAAGAHAIHADDLASWVARAGSRQSSAIESLRAGNLKTWQKK